MGSASTSATHTGPSPRPRSRKTQRAWPTFAPILAGPWLLPGSPMVWSSSQVCCCSLLLDWPNCSMLASPINLRNPHKLRMGTVKTVILSKRNRLKNKTNKQKTLKYLNIEFYYPLSSCALRLDWNNCALLWQIVDPACWHESDVSIEFNISI